MGLRLMHKTIINQHQNISDATIVSKDYRKPQILPSDNNFALEISMTYLKIVLCDLFRVLYIMKR